MVHKPMTAWDIFKPWAGDSDEYLDTVFYVSTMNADQVRDSLIKHDGFDSDIIVKKNNSK